MPSGDGLLARVKPRDGSVSATDLRTIADTAARCGNGRVEITLRGNLQIRGLSAATAPHFAAAMIAAGLADADPSTERARNLIAPPLLGDDPGLASGTARAVASARRILAAAARWPGLPPKFSLLVDGGGAAPLDGVGASIRIAVRGDAVTVTRGQGGAVAPRAGYVAYAGTGRGAFALGLPPGGADAAMLHAAAALAERFGNGRIGVAPWRCLMLHAVPAAHARALATAASAAGLVADAADPRLRVRTCAGRPACAAALADTLADVAPFAAMLPPGALLHLAGCAKGCAHPGPAPLVLVGTTRGYDLVRAGRAGDTPALRGLDHAAALRALAS